MDAFTPDQTRYILDSIGVGIVSETETHWLCLCPFHGNMNTPAMVVDKEEGIFLCNNAACDARGTIRQMIESLTGKSLFQVEFLIHKAQRDSNLDVSDYIKKKLEPIEFPKYPAERVTQEYDAFWNNPQAVKYMTDKRKFEERTLKEFRVGYNAKTDSITVPMFDVNGAPIGCIGRGVSEKTFKNSKKLPKRHTLFNIHNAKKQPVTVITEASFDAMRVWQATGTHAVATLGSYIGDPQAEQISKYFSSVILGPDDDQHKDFKIHCRRCRREGHDSCQGHNTGYELGLRIVEACPGTRMTWAHLDSIKRFDGMKDFGDMTDEQIKYSIDNSVSNYEMTRRHMVA